jgi:hypothetical protein
MAELSYIVYPGYGRTAPGEAESYIDTAELAALYGLDIADYEEGVEAGQTGTVYDSDHIHLLPRPDGRYRNIKTELGDNDTDVHYRKMVNPKKWRKNNNEINGYRTR